MRELITAHAEPYSKETDAICKANWENAKDQVDLFNSTDFSEIVHLIRGYDVTIPAYVSRMTYKDGTTAPVAMTDAQYDALIAKYPHLKV